MKARINDHTLTIITHAVLELVPSLVYLEGCDVLRWQGDKIVEQWRYNNYLAILQQLGMIPAPD